MNSVCGQLRHQEMWTYADGVGWRLDNHSECYAYMLLGLRTKPDGYDRWLEDRARGAKLRG